jgi:hypothetical protein
MMSGVSHAQRPPRRRPRSNGPQSSNRSSQRQPALHRQWLTAPDCCCKTYRNAEGAPGADPAQRPECEQPAKYWMPTKHEITAEPPHDGSESSRWRVIRMTSHFCSVDSLESDMSIQPGEPANPFVADSGYSLRRACIGSTCVARNAGRNIAERETSSRMTAEMQ